jgi:ATP-binding cassette, subfamily C (CFTR/MRP), member 1
MGQYQHVCYRSITMVRGGLISMLTRKTTDLSVRDVDPASSITLMSADVERIVQGWQTMHEMWANLAEIAVAIVLLEGQLGISCLVPVGVSIGIFLVATRIFEMYTDSILASLTASILALNFVVAKQAQWLEAIEKRISATTTMLGSMKGIKMTGLKNVMHNSIHALRIAELNISKGFRRLLIWNMGVGMY